MERSQAVTALPVTTDKGQRLGTKALKGTNSGFNSQEEDSPVLPAQGGGTERETGGEVTKTWELQPTALVLCSLSPTRPRADWRARVHSVRIRSKEGGQSEQNQPACRRRLLGPLAGTNLRVCLTKLWTRHSTMRAVRWQSA